MAKPKSPLLSLGATGTIADSLTFQKRGRATIARQKPIPTDHKTLLQLAQRQKYRDAVAVWNALTTEEKEAWRGVCPDLTPYQCFMSAELLKAPPLPPFDIGAETLVRTDALTAAYTLVAKDNPASVSGKIHTIEIWARLPLEACEVATFFAVNESNLSTRDTELIGGCAPR